MSYTTLITDFDNTLYDWFHMWYRSFSAMLREIERISGIPEEVLLPEIRAIHQRFGTSEYAFLIESIPSVREKFSGQDLKTIFDDAIHAYKPQDFTVKVNGPVTLAVPQITVKQIEPVQPPSNPKVKRRNEKAR